MYKLITDLDGLMKKAEKGDLTAGELIPRGARNIVKEYTSALNAYEKFEKKEFSLEDTKIKLRCAMKEMTFEEHEFNSVLIPNLLMLYQDLHTKPKTRGGK